MMRSIARPTGLFMLISLCAATICLAQTPLSRTVSLNVNRQRLDNVLEILSNKGNFYFSYNSNIIRGDSLVSYTATNISVRQILEMLLPDHYEFRESGNYIIIRKAPISLTLITSKAEARENYYTVSGYVLDDETGVWIRNASIYEKSLLASTLTNANGYFRLKLKHRSQPASLTVSKEFYRDTTVTLEPGFDQQITVTILPQTSGSLTVIGPEDYFAPDQLKLRVQSDSALTEYTYTKTDSVKVERTAIGNFLLSSRQKMQSLNLRRFFTSRPVQFSLLPGLGTHGRLSAQVINNFSVNIFGGYNGGVNGLEAGSLFNIDKKNVQYLQAAGLFNIVGGSMKGLQAAGINNTVLSNSYGLQAAGISNIIKGRFSGLQAAGIYNHVSDSVTGLQVGGVANFAGRKVRGAQVAGVVNFSNGEVTGLQISGVINYAKKLKGVQIGLINISDSSEGYSIGLINIVLKGYHKLVLSTDELVDANAAFKTGNSKLYSILQAGMSLNESEKLYTFGYGLGSEWRLGRVFSINPEFTAQQLYLGSWDYANILSKAHLNLNIRLGKYLSLFGGPVYNVYYSEQMNGITGYKFPVPPPGYQLHGFSEHVKGWLGWNVGINFF